VTDSSGAVIPDANIQLKNTATGDVRNSKSNGAGVFSFSSVPTGNYQIEIQASGFRSFEQTGIHLDPGDQRSIREIKMAIGASETVSVTSAMNQISIDSGEQSSLISAEDIKHLSVMGRDVTELLKILPGMAISNGTSVDNTQYDPSQVSRSGALGQYAANGTPINSQALLSDGADITDPGAYGQAVQPVNYDQVAEVKVQTSSFTADTAHGPIVINVIGKSGGADFHGSLYTYARTNQLNSTDWIAKHTLQQKPPDRQVYPGFTFGGPVLIPGTSFNRNKKLTFFVGAEDYAQRNVYAYGSASNATLQALVPTAGMRGGDFSQTQMKAYLGGNYQDPTLPSSNGSCSAQDGNICSVPMTGPQGQTISNGNIGPYLDPLSKAILNGLPLPNTVATPATNYNWITTNLINANYWQTKGRVDLALSDKHKLFGSYSIFKGNQGIPQNPYYSARGSLGGINAPGGGLLDTIQSHAASLNFTSILSTTLTNELYAGGVYYNEKFIPKNLAATQGNPYQGVFNNGSTVQPTLEDYGNDGLPLSRLLDGSYGGTYGIKQIRIAGDNVTKVLGRHTLRGGVFYQYTSNPQVQAFQNSNGTVNLYYFPESFTPYTNGPTVHTTGAVGSGSGGNYLANFMEGQFFQYNQTNFQSEANLYFYNLSGYAQDHWRITSRLTLDIGIRLEHSVPWQDAHGLGIPVFDPAAYAKGTPARAPGILYHAIDSSIPMGGRPTRWAFVEPRGGFAWDPYGQGKTIVRGGFGIYRAHDSWNDASGGMYTVQGQRNYTVTLGTFASLQNYQSVANTATGFVPDSNATAFSRTDDEQPRVRTYNLSVDQSLPKNMVLEVAYVGNSSDKILNNGSTQPTNAADANSLPIGTLFGPQPNSRSDTASTAGQTPVIFAATGQLAVTGLSQAQIDSYKKYPLYNHVYLPQHNTYSNYNGLQVAITRQTGKALFNINYTWSKALGVLFGQNTGYGPDPFNYNNDYTYLSFDRRNVFNASYSYSLGDLTHSHLMGLAINGWEVSGIANYQTGPNMSSASASNFGLGGNITAPQGTVATVGSNTSTCQTATCTVGVSNTAILGTPDVNLQPTLIGDPRAGRGVHQYINGSAFGLPALGTNGAYKLGYLPGPSFFNTDITLAKRFRVTDKTGLQFRAAAFNFLNRANRSFSGVQPQNYQLANYNVTGTGGLNQILSAARNPNSQFGYAPLREGHRILELALRYDF
jgi:hypothetical protein